MGAGGQRTALELALFYLVWVLGIELRLPGLHSKCLCLLGHPSGVHALAGVLPPSEDPFATLCHTALLAPS